MFRKSKFIFIGVCLVLGSMALAGSKPIYTEKTYSLIGKYEVKGDCNWYGKIEIIGRAEGLEILFDETLEDLGGRVVKTKPYSSNRKMLDFDLGNDLFNDCQDPGCVNIVSSEGSIYPKKIKGKWVPEIELSLDLEVYCYNDNDEHIEICGEDLDNISWAESFESCTFVKVK